MFRLNAEEALLQEQVMKALQFLATLKGSSAPVGIDLHHWMKYVPGSSGKSLIQLARRLTPMLEACGGETGTTYAAIFRQKLTRKKRVAVKKPQKIKTPSWLVPADQTIGLHEAVPSIRDVSDLASSENLFKKPGECRWVNPIIRER